MTMAAGWGRRPVERAVHSPRAGYWAGAVDPSYVVRGGPHNGPVAGSGPTLGELTTGQHESRVAEAGRDNRWRGHAAHHEAAHAVVAFRVGLPLVAVSLTGPDGPHTGYEVTGAADVDRLAAILAGTRYDRAVGWPTSTGPGSDTERARDLEARMDLGAAALAVETADRVIVDDWRAIGALAQALLAAPHGRLTGPAAETILRTATAVPQDQAAEGPGLHGRVIRSDGSAYRWRRYGDGTVERTEYAGGEP